MKKISICALISLCLLICSCEKEPITGENPMEEVSNDPPNIELTFTSIATLKEHEGDDYTVEVPRDADLRIEYNIDIPGGLKSATFDGDPLSDVGQLSVNSGRTQVTFTVTLIYLSGGLPPYIIEVEDNNGKKALARLNVTLPLGFDPATALDAEWEEVTFEPFSTIQFGEHLFATKEGSLLTHFDNTIYRSSDKGVTWVPADSPSFNGWFSTFTQAAQGKIYVGTYEPASIYESNDDGMTWTEVQTNLPTLSAMANLAISENGEIYASAWLNVQNSNVDGVYKSSNGTDWERVLVIKGMEGISLGPNSEVFVHTSFPATLKHSKDGGETWNALNIPPGEFLVDASRMEAGILISSDRNVFLSQDEGETWNPFNNGLPEIEFVKNMSIMESGELYVTPGNYGVFKLTEGQVWRSVGTNLGTYRIKSLTNLNGQLFASGLNHNTIYKLK